MTNTKCLTVHPTKANTFPLTCHLTKNQNEERANEIRIGNVVIRWNLYGETHRPRRALAAAPSARTAR